MTKEEFIEYYIKEYIVESDLHPDYREGIRIMLSKIYDKYVQSLQKTPVSNNLYLWDTINGDVVDFENLESLKKYVNECFVDEIDGVHPDADSFLIFKEVGSVDFIDNEEAGVEIKYKLKEQTPVSKMSEYMYKQLQSRDKPFFVDTFRKLLNQYDKEEISLSKFVEVLNIEAINWRQTPVSGVLPLSGGAIVDKALNRSRKLDTAKWDLVSFRLGYIAGFKDAQSIAVGGNNR